MTLPFCPPVGLADIIATHRALFGDAVMVATEPEPPQQEDAGADKKEDADGEKRADGDEKLGEGGIKALKAEREARQALEAQVRDLAPLKAQMDAIAAAFGVKGGDKAPDVAEQVASLQQRIAQMDADTQRAADVDSILNTSDKNGTWGDRLSAADVALLKSLPSREAMEAVAKRLVEGAKPGIPKPDRSVAQSGSGSSSGGSVTAGRDMFRDRHHKTTS